VASQLGNQEAERHGGAGRRLRTSAFGAIDLGTNNCRLLVARPEGSTFRVIDAFSRIVRLGEGVSTKGELSDQAMERTIAALRVCAGKLRHHQVNRVRSVATDACRRAANCDAFIARVARETGIDLELISTREEAQLAIAGCLPLIQDDARWALMFDIGGGSTELVWMRCQGSSRELIGWTSLPCGVVTLAEAHGGDQVSPEIYHKMVSDIGAMLSPFDAEHEISQQTAGGETQMLGTSGTVTTIAGVHLNLPRYDRSRVDGLQLSFDAIDAVSAHLIGLDQKGRAAIPSIGPDRADLVVAGCAILDAIRKQWPVGSLWVADRGIREGMLMDMIHPCRPAPTFAS
jgi:exopolyphosphatase/guanosine-5'-triphosphate,3'-diphosphate pyrophosphatase